MGSFWSPFLHVYPHVRSLKSGEVSKKVPIWELYYLGSLKRSLRSLGRFLWTFLSVLTAELMVLVNTPRLIHCVMIYCCGKKHLVGDK